MKFSHSSGKPPLALNTSIQYLKGVGPRLGEYLKQKNIYTAQDALYFFPRTYEDRAHFTPIRHLKIGERQTSFGTIRSLGEVATRIQRMKFMELVVQDTTGILWLKWFRYNLSYMKKKFKVGSHLVFSGEVKHYRNQLQIVHPDVEIVENPEGDTINFGRIVPVYSLTQGLYQKTLRRIVHQVTSQTESLIVDPLPSEIKKKHALLELGPSLCEIHYPSSLQPIEARRRLVFDEFFYVELALALKRSKIKKETSNGYPTSTLLKQKLLASLPFSLTAGQQTVLKEIEGDLSKPHPMLRLLQGDVGSGKTLVATLSALSVLEQNHQVALMVPTEILAEQHFETLCTYLAPLHISCTLLKSDLKKGEKTQSLSDIASANAQFIIGTHALIEEEVVFKNLGLVIIDEQHRFGVEQRLKLKQKGGNPHLLFMTATPIPRTLAMTVYGDLDVSLMTDLPTGRKPIQTKVVFESQRLKLYAFLRDKLKAGQQAYVIYPLIEESEKVDLKDATRMAEHLKNIFSGFTIALLHGKLSSDEKKEIMSQFKSRKINMLVSTTVIEVGVDVPNSTLMVIEHAERFGLSQLHQLRGRIGRGSLASFCFLLPSFPTSEEAKIRLKAMEQHQCGFRIAEIDLKLRGPGEFLGTKQSGLAEFQLANLILDQSILKIARQEAFDLIRKDPRLVAAEHQGLKQTLIQRWKTKVDFMGAG
ncbi:MAG: ATP-dependent DNA helicase RecG [Deltaproteobacteria bacterium]|nr:ATP-dependent DNA helicase RecG [Deltaproteobacteria bacterium]